MARKTKRRKVVDAIELHTFAIPAPSWQTPAEAIAYLGGEFQDWLDAIHDLQEFGAYASPTLAHDLARIAAALAEYLARPRSIEAQDEAAGAVPEFETSISEMIEKSDLGVTTEGLGYQGCDATLPLLNRALGYARRARLAREAA